jgi:hypothetical protein
MDELRRPLLHSFGLAVQIAPQTICVDAVAPKLSREEKYQVPSVKSQEHVGHVKRRKIDTSLRDEMSIKAKSSGEEN